MADHIDQINMYDTMPSVNTFSVKEEQCQEELEDKVYISETSITINNDELKGFIWHGKIKQCEEFTCLDNIKLSSFEVTDIQSDNVKVEEGILADIKMEFANGLYCERCEAYYGGYCIHCGMLVHILNNHALKNADSGAPEDLPSDILEIQDCFGQTGIYALRIIPAGVKFGPFTGLSATDFPWEIEGKKFVLDRNKSKCLNWMQYVNPTRNSSERNLHAFQCEDNVYYESTRPIQAHEELLVYFGEVDFVSITKYTITDVFACTFCCLGFSSKSHLAKHKTVCLGDAAGKFSVEELMQCPFCKIHLNSKEYFEHHMAFCSERNVRKGILPTPPTKQVTTASKGSKRCLRQIYKCVQCKYRTKYHADLKEHIEQHGEVKMYKCGICNKRFQTKEYLRLHTENTHAYVGGKDDQEHCTTDYMNTHIKVEQSTSRDLKRIFKCSLCIFRANYKVSLRKHIKTKHLKEFDYKCDSCEYRTNFKNNLDYHLRTKHLKKNDYKCDSCEYRTSSTRNLKRHIKTRHLKEFDFKCITCEYKTNFKNNLEMHVKDKHLNEFDYKCDSCEYKTNIKNTLEVHIKDKHLKEYNYKCDSCEYRTNNKRNLELHIKHKHLKEFNYKCDLCEFGTNRKSSLEYHVKAIHLKEYDYKCDSCEYKTNFQNSLKLHINDKHSKEFNSKCGLCEYRTNVKRKLEVHIRHKHMRQFDFKCESCEFGTNIKTVLKRHIKTVHLKEFDVKCDKCEFKSNNITNLKYHIKIKHLKQFDYKCGLCEYRSGSKRYFESHMKTKHLKEFDYKCHSCEYKTNVKNNLEVHIKDKHVKELDLKCDKCEFRTNNKARLKYHIKTKHLKEFDYECGQCEFRTNHKGNLKMHIKRKH